MNMLKSFWSDEEGLTIVEYAVAGAAIILAVVVGMQTLGNKVSTTLSKVGTALT